MKNMTLAFGKPICVGLYTAFAFMAMKKKPLPLLTLLAMHASEYFLIGKKVAEEHGISTPCSELLLNLVLAKQSLYLGK